MKQMFVVLMVCSVVAVSSVGYASDFEKFLNNVLVQNSSTSTSSTTTASGEYVFAPGDVVVQTDDGAVYYSGYEYANGVSTLFLSYVTQGSVVPLRYSNPSQIRVKGYTFQVISFDGMSLRIRKVA